MKIYGMKKKVLLLLIVCMTFLCLTGCMKHKSDFIEIYNQSMMKSDNIYINIKEGYFYDSHAKFEFDENTVCVAILFTKDNDESWGEQIDSDF